MSAVDQSLPLLSNAVALKIAITCELTTHILTIYIVYFTSHGLVYLAGQRKKPGKTLRMLSISRSAFVHHF